MSCKCCRKTLASETVVRANAKGILSSLKYTAFAKKHSKELALRLQIACDALKTVYSKHLNVEDYAKACELIETLEKL